MEKILLMYGFKDQDRLEKIRKEAEGLSIAIKELNDDDLYKTIGQLMGIDNNEAKETYKGQDVDTEFMLFSDFDRAILQKFIMALRANGITVAHKSVLTENNKTWQLGFLIDHIMDEHQVMQVFSKLKALMAKASELYKANPDPKIKEAMDYAISLNQINDVQLKDVEDRYKKLKEVVDE